MIAVSPKLGEFLTQATDIETALWRVVSEYLAMKMEAIDREIAAFEAKWHMSFAEFVGACRNDTLGRDIYSYTEGPTVQGRVYFGMNIGASSRGICT